MREDTGDLSNWETLLFKGVVKRTITVKELTDRDLDGRILPGLDEKIMCVLDSSLDIISLTPELVEMLGYKSDQHFNGVSVGALLRCSDGTFSKDWISGLFSSA